MLKWSFITHNQNLIFPRQQNPSIYFYASLICVQMINPTFEQVPCMCRIQKLWLLTKKKQHISKFIFLFVLNVFNLFVYQTEITPYDRNRKATSYPLHSFKLAKKKMDKTNNISILSKFINIFHIKFVPSRAIAQEDVKLICLIKWRNYQICFIINR